MLTRALEVAIASLDPGTTAIFAKPVLAVRRIMGCMIFYIGSYDIVDPEEFKKYPPLVAALLPKYGGVVLASDTASYLLEGTARTMNAIIRFPSKAAALGSTRNISMVLVEEFVTNAPR
jgi:uncharacterized protein (DUF1330 family)